MNTTRMKRNLIYLAILALLLQTHVPALTTFADTIEPEQSLLSEDDTSLTTFATRYP